MAAVNVVFDGSGRFVEVEDDDPARGRRTTPANAADTEPPNLPTG